MKLFPATEIKALSDCKHGEFISVRVRAESHSGLCIRDENDKPKFLVLKSPDQNLVFRLIQHERGGEVLAYGTDWTLSPFGKPLSSLEAPNTVGAFIQTREGLFILGRELGNFDDPLLCRLDEPGVWATLSVAASGFAFPYWRIHYFDEKLGKLQKLAGNDPAPDEE
ncbi:hypothetical protein ACXYMO_04735 [Arenibacterium sp. CAU 1754]